MNKNQGTKEKNCIFYVSDYHFEMISLPYMSKNMEEEKKIVVLTENSLEDTVKTLALKINLKDEKKQRLLEINWKKDDENKLNKIKKYVDEEEDIIIFIKGKNEYIKQMNGKIEKVAQNYSNIKIIDCYNLEEVDECLGDIMVRYNNVIGTVGEKSL